MVIKTDMLRYFVEVAQVGNLTQAAEHLGRSPAAVSMMLKQFEEHVGAPLFETDRKNKLTAVGRFALAEAEDQLNHFDQTVSSILNFAESGEACMRIVSIPTIASTLLPDAVQKLYNENPKLMLHLSEMLTGPTLAAIMAGTADIGIVNEFIMSNFPSIDHKLLVSDKYGILCPRDSVIGRKDVVYWSDLAGATMIDSGIGKTIDEPVVQKALRESRIQARSLHSLHSFVAAGMGVTVVTALGCRKISRELVFRIPEGEPHRRNVYIVWNGSVEIRPRVKILRDYLIEIGASVE